MAWGYTPGHTLEVEFTVQNPATGALINADSMPTAVLTRNGVDTAEAVTVTNKKTGVYLASVTIPAAWVASDDVALRVEATVGGVSAGAMMWQTVLVSATQLVLGPLVASARPANRVGSPVELEMFKAEAKTFALSVYDENDDPIDLSGKTMRFVVLTRASTPTGVFKVEDADIAVQGDNNEIAAVAVDSTDSNIATGVYDWRLWDVTAESVLLHGTLTVVSALTDVS